MTHTLAVEIKEATCPFTQREVNEIKEAIRHGFNEQAVEAIQKDAKNVVLMPHRFALEVEPMTVVEKKDGYAILKDRRDDRFALTWSVVGGRYEQ